MEKETSPTRSAERVLDILTCFIDAEELTLTEIAERTNLSPSTTHRLILALQSKGFLKRDEHSKKFCLGGKMNRLANGVSGNVFENLKRTAYPYMLELNRKYNENVRLFIVEGTFKCCIEAVESTRELRQIIRIGDCHPLLRGAAGKVLIAYMKEEKKNELFKEKERKVLLEKIRQDGYAVSDGEIEAGLIGIACPIMDKTGEVVAALSLSGPSIRFSEEKQPEQIQDTIQAAKKISSDLGYREPMIKPT